MKQNKNSRGTTMVEVLVAFAVLILIMGIFSQALSMAGRMFGHSNQILMDYRELAREYYIDSDGQSDGTAEMPEILEFENIKNKADRIDLSVIVREYEYSKGGSHIYDVIPDNQ